jgi:nitrogen fixation protein FixH
MVDPLAQTCGHAENQQAYASRLPLGMQLRECISAKHSNREFPMTELAKPIVSPANETRHRRFWVGLILALLAGQIVLMGSMVYLATSDATFAIEPDYYQKGLNWNVAAAQARQNERLGWSAKIELGPDIRVTGERTLTCALADRAGQPLDGATVDAVAFSHARGSDRTAVTLLPAASGQYEAPVRFTRAGVWEFRLAIQRGPDTFTYVEQRDVYPSTGNSR